MKSQVPRRCPAHKYCGIRCSYRTTLHAPVLLELPSVFSTRVESDQSDHLSTDRAILLPYPSLDLPESRPDKSRVDTVLDRIVPSPRPRRLPAVLCLAFVRIWPSQANRRGQRARLASCGPSAEIPEQRSECYIDQNSWPKSKPTKQKTQKSHTDVLGSSGVRDGRTRSISRLRNTSGYAT